MFQFEGAWSLVWGAKPSKAPPRGDVTALMSFWLVANRSFTSESAEQLLPLRIRMLAAAGLPDAFSEKIKPRLKKAKPSKKSEIVKQHEI